MMIPSPSPGDRYAAASPLDRALRSGAAIPGDADAASQDTSADSGPGVAVTLSRGSSSPSTYDASGRVAGPPTPDDASADQDAAVAA